MGEEEKDQGQQGDAETAEPQEPRVQEESPAGSEPAVEQEAPNNHLALKRGRMVAAGLVAAVILSLIAVAVAGIFQFTSQLLMPCPKDLAVNDPAKVLWTDVVSDGQKPASLGVPENLAKKVSLKTKPAASK